jgi:hypothetical protein
MLDASPISSYTTSLTSRLGSAEGEWNCARRARTCLRPPGFGKANAAAPECMDKERGDTGSCEVSAQPRLEGRALRSEEAKSGGKARRTAEVPDRAGFYAPAGAAAGRLARLSDFSTAYVRVRRSDTSPRRRCCASGGFWFPPRLRGGGSPRRRRDGGGSTRRIYDAAPPSASPGSRPGSAPPP